MRWPLVLALATIGVLEPAASPSPVAPAASPSPVAPAAPVPQEQPPALTDPTAHKPSGPINRADCVKCHPQVKSAVVAHGPVQIDACDACHAVVNAEDHTFRLAREGVDMCTFCHDVDVDSAPFVHEPIITGDCASCHDPHGGADRMMLRATSARDLCSQCHEDVVGNHQSVHGPAAAGACLACHSAHSSEHAGLLSASGPQLCTGCHATTQRQIDTLRSVHAPVNEDCQVCHDPHASDHDMMLKDEPQALCLSCHESLRHTVQTASTQHAAVTTERGCLNCHDPHASDHARILIEDSMTLCFECHDETVEMPDGSKLGNIKQIIETSHAVHGPIAQNNCEACHQIHGGDNFRLLTKEYPPEFYAPFQEESYALCFSCHDRELVQNDRTTSLTNFRNGDLNLHYLHVNRDKKGRTCRACHETHASNNPKHVRDSVPFGSGGWELPIKFQQAPTGGSCAPGCHAPYTYDRESPVTYGVPTEPAIWPSESNDGPASEGDEERAP